MTPAEALGEIRGYAAVGRVVFTRHARQRMRDRGAGEDDVVYALAHAISCAAAEANKWRVNGKDKDGDELTAVVAIENAVVVVTLF